MGVGDIERELKIKATADATQAKAELAALGVETTKVAGSTAAVGEGALTGEAGLQAFAAELKATSAAAAAVGTSATSAAEGVSLFSRAMTALSGPLGILITVLIALLTNLKSVGEWFGRVGDSLDTWVHGVGEGTKVIDAHGKVVEALDPKYKALAEAQDNLARAQTAASAGVIAATDDLARLTAEYLVHQAALHGTILTTKEFTDAYKELGIKIPETFDKVQASATAFLALYATEQKKGALAAREFAEENETLLNRVFAKYVAMGQQIPPELKKIADSIGFVSKAETELAKNDDLQKKTTEKVSDLKQKYADLTKALDDSAKAFKAHSEEIEKNRKTATAAIDATTAATIRGLQQEVKANEDAHNARTISDTKYFENVNRLFAEQAIAKQKAYEAERVLNEKAAKDQVDLAAKFADETRKRKEALDDTRVAEEAAEARLKSLNTELFNQTAALAAVNPKLFQAGIAFTDLDGRVADFAESAKTGAQATGELGVSLNISAGQMVAVGAQAAALTGQFNVLAAAAAAAAAAVASVTSGPQGTSGGGGGGGY